MHNDKQLDVLAIDPVESLSENYLVVDTLQKMPTIVSRGLIYLIVTVLLSLLIYSLFGKMDIVAECSALARPFSHKTRVLSDRNGYVENIFVAERQVVAKGDPLFYIRSKEALARTSRIEELRESIPLKQASYDTKIAAVRNELKQLLNTYKNTLKIKKLKLEQSDLSFKSMSSDLNYWQTEVESLKGEYESIKKLFEQGIISIMDYNRSKSKFEKARSEVSKLLSERTILLKKKNIIEEELKKEEISYTNGKTVLESKLKHLEIENETALTTMEKDLEVNAKMLSLQSGISTTKNAQEQEHILRAETSGVISELYFKNTGEYVRESDLLCTILPVDGPLYMDIAVANKDIGFIEENMKIKYKFDAFPYSDYGTLLGSVSAISPSAVESENLGFIFNLQGDLDKTYFEIRGKKYPIKAGMTAIAELIVDKKSIFNMIFNKMKKS